MVSATKSVETSLVIAADGEAVLEAFLDVEAMQVWWGLDRGLVEAREGGVWALTFERSPQGFAYVTTGRIDTLIRGERVQIGNLVYVSPERPVLGPLSLSILAERVSVGVTLMTIRQDGYGDGADWSWYYQAVLAAWPDVATRVKRYVEQGPEAFSTGRSERP
jgi:hypothetical protein